jgi:hypothetical protein
MARKASKNILLVEGKDDEHVFYHLLAYHNIPEGFRIKNKNGIDNLLETLEVELQGSGLERLGIVVDADTNLAARWQSLRHILSTLGYTVPDNPEPNGTLLQQKDWPVVGIWLMPDNTLPGMLEDFISALIPSEDSLWKRALDCVQHIPEEERRFLAAHQSKAQIHTWLAWQDDPGTPLGLSITKRYLNADAPLAHNLMNWIRRLFDLA